MKYTHDMVGEKGMENQYNGGLTREQFLFYEIRTVASLILQGLSREDIIEVLTKEKFGLAKTAKRLSGALPATRASRECLYPKVYRSSMYVILVRLMVCRLRFMNPPMLPIR